MTSKEFEKMFLDLNSVLVKFWIEQGRPDKEIKIELLERMLNWYKKMGYCTLDAQSASGSSKTPNDLEEAAKKYATEWHENPDGSAWKPYFEVSAIKAFIAGAKWQKEQMMKEAVEGKVFMSFAPGHNQMVMADVDLPTNTKVRIIIVKED